MKSVQRHWTAELRSYRIGISGIVLFLAFVLVVSASSTSMGPPQPPISVSTLDSAMDLSDFVSKTLLQQQRLKGPMSVVHTVGASDTYPARLGYTDGSSNNIGALGIGEASVAAGFVPPLPFDSGNYGVYGYAANGASNYGIHAVSALGTGVGGTVNRDTDFAGHFTGPVRIENTPDGVSGSLTIQKSTNIAEGGMVVGNPSAVALRLNSVTQAGATTGGIIGTSVSSAAYTDTGVIGKSTLSGAQGIAVTSLNVPDPVSGSSLTGYGIYGYTANGNGVIGEGDTARSIATGVYGESRDYGVYGKGVFTVSTESGAGVFACGTLTSADFQGHVRVLGELQMGVASDSYDGGQKTVTPSFVLTEQQLQTIAGLAGVTLKTLP
ncbi:MAG: hypothetical protein HY422_03175 [Candidatus Komeilibacteria bacterium]|nr:hypothetical protein [Candidatus Komeilibacteria bacterium]